MRTAALRCSASLTRALLSTSRSYLHFNTLSFKTAQLTAASIGVRRLHQSFPSRQVAAAEEAPNASTEHVFTKFKELGDQNILHPTIINTLTQRMGLDTMTEVQSRTISEAIKGTDIVAQARTGTGKTLAFLMPVLQNIIKDDPNLARPNFSARGPRTTADDIRALIISPTRELAEQIAVEAKKLVQGTSVVVQTAVGGTQKSAGLRAIQREGCHILVGTPGRLHDILTDEYSRVQAPDLSALVFDEADRLLDQGFWPAIQTIMKILPSAQEKERQTLMFSATVPREVVDLVRRTLKPGFQFVQCVNNNDEPTHERVSQKIVVTHGMENNLSTLVELCTREIQARQASGGPPFKAIVYFPSTAEVTLAQSLLSGLQSPTDAGDTPPVSSRGAFGNRRGHPWSNTEVIEIHGKLAQGARTRAADTFRRARSGILLSSDVTARGLDFPDVTHVIQMGTPPSNEQYIHRIGRTARAGKEGEGWLIVSDIELREARSILGRLPIKRDETLEVASLDLSRELQVSANAGRILSMVQTAMARVSDMDKNATYRALIGVYQRFGDKFVIVESLRKLAQYGWGCKETPIISPGIAQKLGLSRIPGIRIGHVEREQSDDRRGGFGGGYGGGSGGGRSSFGGRDREGAFGGAGRDRQSGFGGSGRDREGGFGGSGRDRAGGFGGGDRYGGGSSSSRSGYGGGSSNPRGGGSGGRSQPSSSW